MNVLIACGHGAAPVGVQAKADKSEHELANKDCITSLAFHPKRDDQLLVVGSHTTRWVTAHTTHSKRCTLAYRRSNCWSYLDVPQC